MKEKTIINVIEWIAAILLYIDICTTLWGMSVFYKVIIVTLNRGM